MDAWVYLTPDPGTVGQVSQIARAGSQVYLAGDWLGTLGLPGAPVLASDQDAFLIEVSGL